MALDFPRRYLTRFYLNYGRNLSVKNYIRAGIFPFFRYKGKKHFILSISSIGGELSDFAGKKEEKDLCWKETAVRELYEESSKLFNFDKQFLDESSEIVYDGKCVYSFVEIKVKFNIKEIVEGFRKNQEKLSLGTDIKFKETCGIFIVDEFEMQNLLQGKTVRGFKLWTYIRLFFSNGKRWPILKFNKSKHHIDMKNLDGFIECSSDRQIDAVLADRNEEKIFAF